MEKRERFSTAFHRQRGYTRYELGYGWLCHMVRIRDILGAAMGAAMGAAGTAQLGRLLHRTSQLDMGVALGGKIMQTLDSP